MPCHPRRGQLRFYRIHREGQCFRALVPCHRLVVRGDREEYRSLIFYDNCGAYISQFLQKRGALSANGRGTSHTQIVGQPHGCVDSPQTVTATPVMLRGVSSSPKSKADVLIVATSFAIPAIDIGTTPTRCIMLQCMALTMGPTN